MTEERLRAQRIQLEREIGALFQQLNRIWSTFIVPNLGTGKLLSSTPPGRTQRVMSAKEAELLDRSTPTGALEYGRAHLDAVGAELDTKRKALIKVERELQSLQKGELLARAEAADAADERRPGPEPVADGQPDGAGISLGLREQRLVAFQRLVHDARSGQSPL